MLQGQSERCAAQRHHNQLGLSGRVSTTLKSADWDNSTLITGDLAREITELKQHAGKNIGISGSASLVLWLLRHNLLDETNALLDAAWAEVRAVGYANLSMERIAARARTNKSVLYRRWPNRASLVRAAMRRHLGVFASEVPDTGRLRGDVFIVLRHFRDSFQEVGPDVIHGLMAELPDVPKDVFEVVTRVMMAILSHAASRGEVRLGRVTPRTTALPGDLLRHALTFSPEPDTDAVIAEIIDDIFLPLVAT